MKNRIGPGTAGQAQDVNVQDQATELVNLYLSEQLSTFTLTQVAARDTRVITGDVDPGYVPNGISPHTGQQILGEIVCLKEGRNFDQCGILDATNNGGDNWTLTLDTPLDAEFSLVGGCSIRGTNMVCNASLESPCVFDISPGRLDPDLEWDIVRCIISGLGPGSGTPPNDQPDDTTFLAGAPLVNGLVWRTVDGRWKNQFNAKTNADLGLQMYDAGPPTDKNKNGEYGYKARRTYGGQSKNGIVIRLRNAVNPAEADSFQFIWADDTTDQTLIRAVVQGHVTD